MNTLWLSHLQWNVRRLIRLLGWPGVTGIGLLVLSSTFHIFALPLLVSSANDLRDNTHRARRQLAENRNRLNGNDPAVQLQAFYEFFPNDEEIERIPFT